jgi:hypothetical protein
MYSNKTTSFREFNPSDMINNSSNNLFDEDDFISFLDKLSKEKIKYGTSI